MTVGHSAKEYREGYEAASRSQTFRDYCPYTYGKCGAIGQVEFDRTYRPKMDAWFAGWKAWLDEHGLGFNFQPVKKAKKR